MAGVLYVAVVSRMIGMADTALHWLPSYLRGSRRRSIYTPKEDSNVGAYAGESTRAMRRPHCSVAWMLPRLE